MQGSRAGPHRQQFWPGPGAQGNINLQGYRSLAFTCLKLFQNLATEIQVIKYTLLEYKKFFCPPSPLWRKAGCKTLGMSFLNIF